VRRDGGLGSIARFPLNRLYDNQERFFLDAVPLEIAGYPFGFANVPVNVIKRVEVFRGVVPIRFGADALGGVARSAESHFDPAEHALTGPASADALRDLQPVAEADQLVELAVLVAHELAACDFAAAAVRSDREVSLPVDHESVALPAV
jgi:hypothetical protein